MKSPGVAALLLLAGLNASCSSLMQEEERPRERPPLTDEQASSIYVDKGVNYMEAGQYEVALQDLQKALELNDENSEAHNAIAVLYQRIDDPSQADSHFRKALSLKPDNFGARNNYGRFLCLNERPQEAFEQFSQVIGTKLYGQPWIPLTNAGVCARSIGRLPQAENYLRQALVSNASFPPALLEMARVSRETGQAMAARGFLQRYLTATGPTPEALMLGVEIEMGLGNQQSANDYLQTLHQKFPDSTEVMQARQKLRQ